MPAPTNQTAATAIDIGTVFPYSTTQDVNFGGTTYTVWYKYVAQTGDVVIGVFAFGDLVAYTAKLAIFSPDGVTTYLGMGGSNNVPAQFPVIVGNTYFFKISSNSGNVATAILSLSARRGPTLTAASGALWINDDTSGFPLALLSATDGTVRRFVQPFAASDNGDVLNSGLVLVQDNVTSKPALYDAAMTLILATTVAFAGVISTNKTTLFYVGDPGGGAVKAKVTTVSNVGIQGATTWTFAVAGLTGMAPSPDETILYYTGSGGATNAAVKRWDLVNDVALTNLVAGIANYNTRDIVVLTDGTLLVVYFRSNVDTQVLHYSAAGATLNAYTFSVVSNVNTRICRALDDPLSFWIFLKQTAAGANRGLSRIQNIQVSDGTVLTTFDPLEFEGGAGQAAAAATPAAYFGHSQSCPILVLRAALPPFTPPVPCTDLGVGGGGTDSAGNPGGAVGPGGPTGTLCVNPT